MALSTGAGHDGARAHERVAYHAELVRDAKRLHRASGLVRVDEAAHEIVKLRERVLHAAGPCRRCAYEARATSSTASGRSRVAPAMTTAPATMNAIPTSSTTRGSSTPSSADAAKGASDPRMPSRRDCAAA